jgi:hypothetical protein
MRRFLLSTATVLALVTFANAQTPGWIPTGEWQCGPHVRVIVSTDGFGALDWFVVGAWFDNHYTLRRGGLYYNGISCAAVGNVWPNLPPRKKVRSSSPSDERCNDTLRLEDREKYCE